MSWYINAKNTTAYGDAVGTLYNNTTVPFPSPSATLLGMRIPVVNSAVPRGYSWLECNGTAWVPPSGELIAAVQPTSETSPVALVTPGVTTLVMIARSEIIPDYMLPNLLEWDVTGTIGAQNATGTGSCLLGIGISGQLPSVNNIANYPLNNVGSPPQIAPNFGGNDPNASRRLQTRRGTIFRHPNNMNRNFYDYASPMGPFVSGANRLYAMAAPDSTVTVIRLDAMSAYSRGNL